MTQPATGCPTGRYGTSRLVACSCTCKETWEHREPCSRVVGIGHSRAKGLCVHLKALTVIGNLSTLQLQTLIVGVPQQSQFGPFGTLARTLPHAACL